MSRRVAPGGRVDAVVGAVVVVAAVSSLIMTSWLAFRSVDAVISFAQHPLRLQEAHALLTGLLSANLLILQVVFMARLPWIERHWGRVVIMRRHRRLGYWSFWLMVAHVLLFVLQRTQRDPNEVGRAMVDLFLTGRWMLLATVGTALLVLVVATSIVRARRRLRYESWHLIHLWAYVGIALALPHELVSRDFTTARTTIYWWTLYVLALGSVLVFRVGVPVYRTLRHRLRVAEVRPAGASAVSVIMTGERLPELRTRAGQFFVWRFLGSRGWTRAHPYSLSQAPAADRLRVTVGTTGDGGRRAATLHPGSRVIIEGPVRRGDHRPAAARAHADDRGGGRDHPRFLALLEDLELQPGEATVIHRVHDRPTAVLGEELAELAERRGAQLIVLPGARRSTTSWLPVGGADEHAPLADDATELLALVPDVADRDVYLCGPTAWMTAVARAAVRVGVANRDLHTEEFSW